MTERSAEQAPVQTRPDHQDTARIPLSERLQRRISASDERRASGQAQKSSGRVLPPPPPELTAQREREEAERLEAERQAAERQAAERRAAELRASELRAVPSTDTQSIQTPSPVAPAPVREPARRTAATAPVRGPRRARLRLSRIDPWSVMKVSFLLAIAFGIVTVVSVFMVWSVLSAAGVWSSINNTVSDTLSSGNNTSTFNIEDYLGMSRVLGFTMLVSVIDVILITAIATLAAFLYNMAASLLGGIEVTLAEDQA
jgi:Transmembrane domain of unknown function (DUF3566)